MKPTERTNCGFTLIEMMLSLTIGMIILLAAASVLGSSGDSYERVGGGAAVEREARAVIGQLGSDLSTAMFHKDSVFETSAADWPVDRIGFLTLQPSQAQTDDGRIGDLCAVNYYIKDIEIGRRSVRCLMRGFRESAETFMALGDGTVPSLFSAREVQDEPVAFGVVSYEARPVVRAASGDWLEWENDGMTGPEALEVRLVLARRGLLARLKTTVSWDESGVLGAPSEASRNKDLEIYTARIQFGNHEAP